MRLSPFSFVLGIAAASLAPMISRVFRPFAVEAAAAGMGMVEDARRIIAEQMETLEDIVAEARARREHLDADAATALHTDIDAGTEEPIGAGRARPRAASSNARRRHS